MRAAGGRHFLDEVGRRPLLPAPRQRLHRQERREKTARGPGRGKCLEPADRTAAEVVEECPQRDAVGHFVDAGPREVARDREEAASLAAVDALIGIPLPALDHDGRRPGECLHVADQRRLVVEAVGLELGRLVAGLAAAILHRLDERALFATDVAPGAREHLHGEGPPAAEDVLATGPDRLGAGDFSAHDGDLFGILVPDVDPPPRGAGDQARQDHPLQHEMRVPREQFAILESARLALVGVTDDVLRVALRLPDVVPLLVGGHSGAAHAAQVGSLELVDDGLLVTRSRECPHGVVGGWAHIGIDPPRLVGMRLVPAVEIGWRLVAGERVAGKFRDLAGRAGGVKLVVDHGRHRTVAAAQARGMPNAHPAGGDVGGQRLLHFLLEPRTATLMTGHVVAHVHLDGRRRLEFEVREEAGHLLKPVERRAGPLGELSQLLLWQIAVPMLNMVEFLNDHRNSASVRRCPFSLARLLFQSAGWQCRDPLAAD